jgi:hypothetical protein
VTWFSRGDQDAVLVDGADAVAEVMEVEQVAVGDDQVGDLAWFQRAEFVVQAHQRGGGQGSGVQRLGPFHASLHEQFQFAQILAGPERRRLLPRGGLLFNPESGAWLKCYPRWPPRISPCYGHAGP